VGGCAGWGGEPRWPRRASRQPRERWAQPDHCRRWPYALLAAQPHRSSCLRREPDCLPVFRCRLSKASLDAVARYWLPGPPGGTKLSVGRPRLCATPSPGDICRLAVKCDSANPQDATLLRGYHASNRRANTAGERRSPRWFSYPGALFVVRHGLLHYPTGLCVRHLSSSMRARAVAIVRASGLGPVSGAR
jgi:hypothetical protein